MVRDVGTPEARKNGEALLSVGLKGERERETERERERERETQ
jgi:hypothetical protein